MAHICKSAPTERNSPNPRQALNVKLVAVPRRNKTLVKCGETVVVVVVTWVSQPCVVHLSALIDFGSFPSLAVSKFRFHSSLGNPSELHMKQKQKN